MDLGDCVTGLVNAAYRGMAEQVASYDLIPLEFALLRAFLGKEEWTTTQLAQVLPVKAPRISRVVTKMVDRGLMRRRRARNDRRVVFLTLTDEGKALTLELHRRVQAYDATLSKGVCEEEMALCFRHLQGHDLCFRHHDQPRGLDAVESSVAAHVDEEA